MSKNTDEFVREQQLELVIDQRLKFFNANTSVNTKTLPSEGDIFVEAGGTVTFLREEVNGSWSSAQIHAPRDKDFKMKLSALVFTPDDD